MAEKSGKPQLLLIRVTSLKIHESLTQYSEQKGEI